ncbi:MAG: hypothetical protein HKN68_02520 [Saprospiraceae bacterium]|nr:hypothetical protein [Saprospiraceae bacterium]
MKFNTIWKYRILNIAALFLLTIPFLAGQKMYVTHSGQTIQLKANGQWQYVEDNTLDDQGLIAESEIEVDPYELPSSAYNISEEEENMYENLKKQLQFFEADFFVRHLIIKNKIDNDDSDDADKKLEKDLKKKYKTSYELLDKLSKFNSSDKNKRDKILEEVKEKLVKEFRIDEVQIQPEKIGKTSSKNTVNLKSFTIDERSSYDIVKEKECELVFNGMDKQLNKKRKEVKSSNWFSYTHPKLLNHFKSNDFLKGEASLMQVDKRFYINLRLILATRDARRSYGYVAEDAMLRISLINGDRIYLKNQIRSDGNLEAYTGNTVYQCLYQVDKDDIKEIKRTEIDKVGIMWSTGFEEYDVYEVDFLMNQLYCLEND